MRKDESPRAVMAWGDFLRGIMVASHVKEKCTMTKAEYESRKRWDESIMTEEEIKAHWERIHSFCGKIDDETFTPSNDADDEDFVKTIDELCGSISDESFHLYREEAV